MNTPDNEKRMKIVRVIFLILCLVLLFVAIFRVKYDVYSLADEKNKQMSSLEFVQQNTSDGLMAKDGRLYDVNSLPKLAFQNKDGVIQGVSAVGGSGEKTKDCKT